jgi:hypothetical protein
MGSISVDTAISKLGTPGEFFQQLEPEQMAEQIISLFEPEIPAARVSRENHTSPSRTDPDLEAQPDVLEAIHSVAARLGRAAKHPPDAVRR